MYSALVVRVYIYMYIAHCACSGIVVIAALWYSTNLIL